MKAVKKYSQGSNYLSICENVSPRDRGTSEFYFHRVSRLLLIANALENISLSLMLFFCCLLKDKKPAEVSGSSHLNPGCPWWDRWYRKTSSHSEVKVNKAEKINGHWDSALHVGMWDAHTLKILYLMPGCLINASDKVTWLPAVRLCNTFRNQPTVNSCCESI